MYCFRYGTRRRRARMTVLDSTGVSTGRLVASVLAGAPPALLIELDRVVVHRKSGGTDDAVAGAGGRESAVDVVRATRRLDHRDHAGDQPQGRMGGIVDEHMVAHAQRVPVKPQHRALLMIAVPNRGDCPKSLHGSTVWQRFGSARQCGRDDSASTSGRSVRDNGRVRLSYTPDRCGTSAGTSWGRRCRRWR